MKIFGLVPKSTIFHIFNGASEALIFLPSPSSFSNLELSFEWMKARLLLSLQKIFSKKEEEQIDSPQASAVTHNLHSMTLVQIQDGMEERLFHPVHYARDDILSQTHARVCTHTRTRTHLDVLLFCSFVIFFLFISLRFT